MSTELQVVQRAIEQIDKVSAGLGALQKDFGGVVYEVTTKEGMESAKSARLTIRGPRYEVERIRKEAKAPILALGKKLDTEAARITNALLAIEEPIDQQIKAEEDRKEREKQAAIEAEMRRVADLQERVAELRGNRTLSASSGSALLAEHISDLDALPVDESFQEFQEQAAEAKTAGLLWLRNLHTSAVSHEAEQARIKAEREELAKLRAAEEQRQAEERARLAEEERIAREARRAEEARVAAERHRQDEERRKQREADEAEARKERERLAAERAEFQRQQEEARRQREAEERERAEQARLANMKRPEDSELVGMIAKHYRVPDSKVIEWLAATNWKKAKAAA